MKRVMFFCATLAIVFACSKPSDNEVSQEQEKSKSEQTVKIEAETTENFYVMATSGLKLREKPNGEKITTIPYRAAVERLGTKTFGALEVEEIKGFKVKGEWVKVRYKDKEGYAFSGFLTKYKMPKQVDKYDYEKYTSTFDYYLRTSFDIDGDKYNVEKMKDCDNENPIYCFKTYAQDFNNGDIKYKYNMAEYMSEEILTFRDMSLAEAYFLIKALDLNGASNPEYEIKEVTTYDKAKKTISIEADGAGCYTDIKEKDGMAEISVSCGC